MADFIYRLAYVVICCAAMAAVWLGIRWLVYGVPAQFAYGLGLGFGIGMLLMYAVTQIDKRNAQRRSKS